MTEDLRADIRQILTETCRGEINAAVLGIMDLIQSLQAERDAAERELREDFHDTVAALKLTLLPLQIAGEKRLLTFGSAIVEDLERCLVRQSLQGTGEAKPNPQQRKTT